MRGSEFAGLYIHIPFCIEKCPYCDFFSITDRTLKDLFLDALILEMKMNCTVHCQFDTLYIGGGTPSLLGPKDAGRMIKSANRFFRLLPDSEITIEANPGTVSLEKLIAYDRAGVNRINIGVQSFQDPILRFLGRIHSAKEACIAIHQAREAGFQNIGIDLIYGIPNQTVSLWRSDLQKAVEFEPDHLSCYTLTFEPGTRMDEDRRKKRFQPLSDSRVAEMFDITTEFLAHHGYEQYEISNFARASSLRSRHNSKYWSRVPYLGLGPSAHSFAEPERRWNHKSVKRYIREINAGRLPIQEKESLTREQRMTEMIYLGLRRSKGIDTDAYENEFGVSFRNLFKEIINPFTASGHIKLHRKHCALSTKGMLFLDSIASIFADHIPEG